MAATIAAHMDHRTSPRTRHATERHGHRARTTTSRPSVFAAALVALLVAAFLAAVSALPTLADRPPAHAASRAVRVLPSDSLWSIAEANRAPRASTDETVRAIRALNRLETSEVAAGSVLFVPAPETSDAAYASR